MAAYVGAHDFFLQTLEAFLAACQKGDGGCFAPLHEPVTVADLVGHAIARSVAQILRHDPGVRLGEDPEDVHQLRVGTRRLRSDLRTFASLLDADRVAAIRAELGWLAALVGAVRDTDVLAARLRASGATLPDADSAAVAALRSSLAQQAGTARAAMLQAMRCPRYLDLLDALVDLAAAPPLAGDTMPTTHAPGRVSARMAGLPWRRLAGAVAALPPDPSDAALHRIRILAKRCRYAAEAVAPLVGPPAARFAATVADVQTVLGDHHDTVVAEAWLRDAAGTEPAAGVAAGELIAHERTRRDQLRRSGRRSGRAPPPGAAPVAVTPRSLPAELSVWTRRRSRPSCLWLAWGAIVSRSCMSQVVPVTPDSAGGLCQPGAELAELRPPRAGPGRGPGAASS